MNCPKCNAELTPGERFCGECGQPMAAVVAPPLPVDRGVCPNCGAKREPDKRFCGECGKDFRAAPEASVKPAPATTSNTSPIPGKPTEPAAKRRRLILATFVSIVIVGAIGFIGYEFLLKPKLEERLYDSLLGCHTDEIRSFLAAGTSPNTKVRGRDWERDRGIPALAVVATTCINTEPVKALIAAGADVNARDNNDWTTLMWAAMSGKTEATKALIAAGADVNAGVDVKGKEKSGRVTALMFARQHGHAEVVRILQQAGATE
jgi:hypothetical protein